MARPGDGRSAAICARIGGFALCCLLALASSVSANCAWIVWQLVLGTDQWHPSGGHETLPACLAGIKESAAAAERMQVVMTFKCLPDTVDPRGPKGTK
jgi:hypothetical protein